MNITFSGESGILLPELKTRDCVINSTRRWYCIRLHEGYFLWRKWNFTARAENTGFRNQFHA